MSENTPQPAEQSLYDTIRELKRENKALRKQLSEPKADGEHEGEGKMKRHRYGQQTSPGCGARDGHGHAAGEHRGSLCHGR